MLKEGGNHSLPMVSNQNEALTSRRFSAVPVSGRETQ